MSDIKLSVGLETSVSATDINKDLKKLLGNLEKTHPKIKVDVELSKASRNTFKKQLEQIVKSVSLGSGSPININLDSVSSGMKKIQGESEKTRRSIESVSKSAKSMKLLPDSTAYNNSLKKTEKLLSRLRGEQEKFSSQSDTKSYTGLTNTIRDTEKLIATLKTGKMTTAQYAQEYSRITLQENRYTEALKKKNSELANSEKNEKKRQSLLKQTASLLEKIENAERNWTKAKKGESSASYKNIQQYRQDVSDLLETLSRADADIPAAEANLRKFTNGFRESSAVIKSANENTKSFGEHIQELSSKFTSWLSVSQIIMFGIRSIKEMINTVVELDTAMTELKKVTDESDATYERFLSNSVNRAKAVGASVKDVVNATADFARLGYDLSDASKLADTAIVYKNVADGLDDISEASSSIISTMQAFKVEASDAMSIVDKFNNVSNKYAISSAGIGEAMQRSASAMHAAGNTIDETIALITAANTVVQNPDSVGTSLKTISMFLRAAKTEAEDAGESTEGMANSVSELRDEILQLTGQKVDIQIDENSFKSTYQIIKEIAGVWGDLTDISKANVLELIGGKRNANVVTALIESFNIAEDVLKDSMNSAGSAMAENEKYLDSIAGKMEKFTASFEALSTTVINSDFIGAIVDAGTVILDVLNEIVKVTGLIGPAIAGAGLTTFFKNLD